MKDFPRIELLPILQLIFTKVRFIFVYTFDLFASNLSDSYAF